MAKHEVDDETSFTAQDFPKGANADAVGEPSTAEVAKDKAAEMLATAGEAARRLPDQVDRAATTTGRLLGTAQQTLDAESDETLLAGAALATGLMIGLLVGGAPRLLAWVAMLPAAAMGATLARRRGEESRSRSRLS